MEESVCGKEREYNRAIRSNETFDIAGIKQLLKSKTENIKCKMHKSKEEKIMTTFNETTNNSRMNKDNGRIIPEIFNRYLSYKTITTTKSRDLKLGLEEFCARGLESKFNDKKVKITTLKKLLMEHESKRFENEVDNVLQRIGVTVTTNINLKTKLALLKNQIDNCKKDNTSCDVNWDDYNVDVEKYFKIQSNEIPENILCLDN